MPTINFGTEYLKELESEVRATRRCLEALPEKTYDWKPHEQSMIMGNLQLNSYNINLKTTGKIIGETPISCIRGASGGTITAVAKLIAPQAANPGNIGVELTSGATLGATVITRGHLPQSFADGGLGIQRHFTITPTNNS